MQNIPHTGTSSTGTINAGTRNAGTSNAGTSNIDTRNIDARTTGPRTRRGGAAGGFVFLPALTLFLILAGSCVTDDTAIRNEMLDIRKDVYKLQEDARIMQKAAEQGKSRTDVLNAMRESGAGLNEKLSVFSKELQVIESRLDETKHLSDKRYSESRTDSDILRAQLIALENRIKELAAGLSKLEGASPAVVVPRAEVLKPAGTVPAKPEEKTEPQKDIKTAYDEALKTFKDGNYRDARDKFAGIINNYPVNSLTANAAFWIGETYYKEGAFEDAIIKYQEMINKFPNSEKVPGAKLKQAFSFANINDIESAKTILKQLIDAYPSTEEADAAKKKLDALIGPARTETPKEIKPEAKPEAKPEGKPEAKPEVARETKPARPDVKDVKAKPEQSKAKPDAARDSKTAKPAAARQTKPADGKPVQPKAGHDAAPDAAKDSESEPAKKNSH